MFSNLARFFEILRVFIRYGLYEIFLPSSYAFGIARRLIRSELSSAPLPIRIRLACEKLGPIFVKLGQVVSTRHDLIPHDWLVQLSQLQDQVTPYSGDVAKNIIEKHLGVGLHTIFSEFSDHAIAAASVAQVHQAVLRKEQCSVAVKILRPGIHAQVDKDVRLMKRLAQWCDFFIREAKRLRLPEVVKEFESILTQELNLTFEAAHASQLLQNFSDSKQLKVPKVWFEYSSESFLVMEWVDGTPISHITKLEQQGIDLKKLARFGVEIFFTQVFRDGFFHADMHPGNIFVANDGRYIAVDFGVMGTLSAIDKYYLAVNFLAFFQRDYLRVATAHIESGWVPKNTNPEALASAVRSVCEPFFQKPLADISFGLVLMRLFEVSRRFHVEIQPQLVLLQKTLLNVEGLGRRLDPELDLWVTAKPFLERWMNEQLGWRALWRHIKQEAPAWINTLPFFPRRLNDLIERLSSSSLYDPVPQKNNQSSFVLYGAWCLGLINALLLVYLLFFR
jgi:ubiquinone biosynthesis protein